MRTATTAAKLEAVRLTGLSIEELLDTDPTSNSFGTLFIGNRGGITTVEQVRAAVRRWGSWVRKHVAPLERGESGRPRARPAGGRFRRNVMRTATTAAKLEAVRLTELSIEELLDTDPTSNSFGTLFIGNRGGITTVEQVRAAVRRWGSERPFGEEET